MGPKVRTNESFERRWREELLDVPLADVALQPRLRELVEAPLLRVDGCLVLQPLAMSDPGADAFPDDTGREAFVNKLHIEDFVDLGSDSRGALSELVSQGAKAAAHLAERLEVEGSFRILLSLDPTAAALTLRFFRRRAGEPWGPDDPDELRHEEVLMLDTGS